jgi:hypothetical protein
MATSCRRNRSGEVDLDRLTIDSHGRVTLQILERQRGQLDTY